jgi:hypothetical protein
MTERRPLVIVSGLQQELPAGDNLTTDYITSAMQLVDTLGNPAEVEAATKALRAVAYPEDTTDLSFNIGRYQVASGATNANVANAMGTSAAAANDIAVLALFARPCVVMLKRISASVASGAVSGTRAGTCRLDLHKFHGMSSIASGTSFSPDTGTAFASGHGNRGLITRQPQSLADLYIQPPLPLSAMPTAVVDTNPISTILSSASSAVGQSAIRQRDLFNSRTADQPLIISPYNGVVVRITWPAAVTSQSLTVLLTFRWDEWQITAPDGR